MIEIDEKTVDQAVDEILGGGTVREGETPSTGGAQVRPDERATCRRCGKIFARQAGSTRTLCQECFAASHSRKRPAANDRQLKTGDAKPQKEAKTVGFGTGDVEKAWDDLKETETGANKPAPEPDPADMEMDELLRTAADAMRRDTGDMILALYETIREVAKASGIQTRLVIETMYEIDCTLSHIGGV